MPPPSAFSPWRTCLIGIQRVSRPSKATGPCTAVQTRGKKRLTKSKTVAVRLREDLPGFGRKGAIVPIVKGQMRNVYFPQRVADYITFEEKRELKRKHIMIERDVAFGSSIAEEGAEIKEVETRLVDQPARSAGRRLTPVRVQLDVLEPSESYKVLDRLLPRSIVFYRTPITQPTRSTDKSHIPPMTPQPTLTLEDSAGPSQSLYSSQNPAIYGSVSSGDIVASVKALVAASPDAAGRIVVGEEDVRFVHSSEDRDRVKQLGDYDIDIKVKGHSNTIRRKVQVLAEEEADIDLDVGRQVVDILAGEAPIKHGTSESVAKIEGQLRQAEEALSAIQIEVQEFIERGRLAQEPTMLTPVEEAEIEAAGDVVPPRRGRQVVLEEQGKEHRR